MHEGSTMKRILVVEDEPSIALALDDDLAQRDRVR